MIIETCPKCGHDLMNTVICTCPPIPQKTCPSCGWNWTGEVEDIQRVPFGGNSYQETPNYLNNFSGLNSHVDGVKTSEDGAYIELFCIKDGIRYNAKTINLKEVSVTLTNSLMDGIEKLWEENNETSSNKG